MLIGNNITVTIDNNNETQTLLNRVSVTLLPGRITCFLGSSGAGKTTLFNTLAQLQDYDGEVAIGNQNLASLSAQTKSELIGIVFQQFNLFAHMNVLENCISALIHIRNMPRDHAVRKALTMLQQLGIQELVQRVPSQLSGGQQQRVAIARALCLSPQVLLLDEPTSSLDPQNRYAVVDLLKKLAATGLAIGVSSHDTAFISNVLDRAYLLDEGKIAEYYDSETHFLKQDCPIIDTFLQQS
jgi:ABC-type polar amino acid transport system ATPase subunit